MIICYVILAHCYRIVELMDRMDILIEQQKQLETLIEKQRQLEEEFDEIINFIKCLKNVFSYIHNSLKHVIHLVTDHLNCYQENKNL